MYGPHGKRHYPESTVHGMIRKAILILSDSFLYAKFQTQSLNLYSKQKVLSTYSRQYTYIYTAGHRWGIFGDLDVNWNVLQVWVKFDIFCECETRFSSE